jgi:hypothetical protein
MTFMVLWCSKLQSQPSASANCAADGRKAERVRHTARAALLLVRVTQSRGEGAECGSADYCADDRAVSGESRDPTRCGDGALI